MSKTCVGCGFAFVEEREFRGKGHRTLRCGNESAGSHCGWAVQFGRGADAVFVEREAPVWCPVKEDT